MASISEPSTGVSPAHETVELKNLSSMACTMHGFPGLGLLDPGGIAQQLDVVRATSAGSEDPAVAVASVTVVPGGIGSFWIEWQVSNGSSTGTLEITPPNQTSQILVPDRGIQLNVGSVTVSAVARGALASTVSPAANLTIDGPYADLYWSGYPAKPFSSLEIPVAVGRLPQAGPSQVPPAYFWGTQFFAIGSCQCSNGNGGYFGLQADSKGEHALIAWWSASAASTTNPVANASTFSGAEGSGARIELPFNFVAGTQYRLRLTKAKVGPLNTTWFAEISDTSNFSITAVGSLVVTNSWGSALQGATTSFTEYYGQRVSNCAQLPVATISYGSVLMNGTSATSGPNFSFGPGSCPTSQTASVFGGYVQTVGA